ncbi:MAG TPA: LytTR family DNA-binding domain-containing protein [Longimicrobiales bacterium]
MRPRVIIVDDEHHARRKIRRFLDGFDVEVIGEYSDRDSAVEGIRTLAPDLVLLDVQLRAATGFDVLAALGVDAMPATIFVTAYDEYAVRAFDVHAVDYLLKPFDRDRFAVAMERALERLERRELPESLRSLMDDLRAAIPARPQSLKWIMAKRADHTSVIIETRDIQWVEAAGNYVYLHTSDARYLHRQPLGSLGDQLDPTLFARVHRSAIVNLSYIRHISPWVGGDYHIRMKSGAELRLSRNYRDAFDRALQRG